MLHFRILGPFEVTEDEEALALGSPRQRALLAILLLHRGELVSSDRLTDELWGERPPPTATKIVQGYVSHLRKVLGEQTLITRGSGYMLVAQSEQVDAERFTELAADGRDLLASGDPTGARELFAQALSLWHGEALADFAYEPFAEADAARLTEARWSATEDRIEADLALGRQRTLIAELEALYRQHPSRERLLGQLMVAHYRSGRQADALEAYRRGRAALSDELGLEPGPELRALQQRILAQDPSLDLVAEPVRATTPGLPGVVEPRRPARAQILVRVGATLLLAAAVAAALVELTRGGAASIRAGANSLAEISIRSDRLVAVTSVGAGPGALTYGEGSLWVANQDDETISRVAAGTSRPLGTIQLRQQPTGIAAAGGAVWAVTSNPTRDFITASRIDPQFDAVTRTVRIANVDPATPPSIAADGADVWIAPQSGDLTRLSSTSAKPVARVDPDASPTGLVSGYGALWLTDSQAGNVIRVDSTGLRTPFPVGDEPTALAAGAGSIWVADTGDDKLVRIDPQTDATTSSITVGDAPSGVAVGGGSVWVANSGDGSVSRVDPLTNRVIAKIEVGGSPQSLVVKGGRVWVTIDAPPFTGATASRQGGTLHLDSRTAVTSMDPAIADDGLSWGLLYASCARLLDYPDRSGSAGLELVPEVATTLPAISDRGTTYTFTIRTGFRFAPPSNQLVTAETFKTTIERTLNPRMASPEASTFADITGASAYMAGRARGISGVVAAGDMLTIRLRAPDPDLPSRLAMPFFCAVPSDTPIDPNGVAVIPSAGPYSVESNTPQGIVLVRNPNYHGHRPHHFDRIEVAENIPGPQAIRAVEEGRADYADELEFTAADDKGLSARYGAHSQAAHAGHQQYFVSIESGLDFFVLNTHRSLFSNQRMRQAVNYAIDRGALARLGDQISTLPDAPFDHYLPPGVPGYSDVSVFGTKPDLKRAKRLARGYAGTTVVLYTCDYAPCPQQAQIVKTDLAAIGLRVHVVEFGSALYSRVDHPGEPFDMAFVNWIADYPDPDDFLNLLLENGNPLPTFRDPSVANKLAHAARLTGTRRYLIYAALDHELAKTAAPFAAYGVPVFHTLFSARIGCQVFSPVYGVDVAALCLRRTH